MNSWIFYLNDSMRTMTAVIGVGTNRAEGEADALGKWDTFASGRSDYTERSPIAEVIYSELCTELGANNMPGLIK